MSDLRAIALLEYRRWLRRPAYWGLLAAVAFGLAFLFLRLVEHHAALRASRLAGASSLTAMQTIVAPFFEQAALLLLALIPLVTMRTIAGERESGSWTLLQTAATPPWRIVLGKLLGVLWLLLPPLLLTAAMPALLLGTAGTLDWGHLLTALAGLTLLVTAFAAAGIHCSARASEAVTAAMCGYGLILLFLLFHATSAMPGALAPTLYWLSPLSHLSPFLEARFDSADLLWLVVFSLLFVELARQRLHDEYRRPPHRYIRPARTPVTIVTAMAVALSLGQFHFSADLSQQKINTAPAAAIQLLEKLDGELTIDAIVADAPTLRRRIEKALRPYLAASRAVSLKFQTPAEAAVDSGQRLQQTGRLELRYGNRTETLHALGQGEILRALQRLIDGREQWIVFLEGHGEKSLFDASSDGYSTLDRLLRQAGFQTQAIDLLKLPAIPDNTTVLVVGTPASSWLGGEHDALSAYLQRGGNILLLRDPGGDNPLDALLDAVAVTPLPGVVIDANERLRKILAIRHPAIVPVTSFGDHDLTAGFSGRLLLPLATALATRDDGKWRDAALLYSSADSWNETADLQGHVRFDADGDERAGPLPLAIAASRPHGEHEQRAVVIGDSDFLDNDYIAFGDNARFALRLFDWLAGNNDAPAAMPHPDEQSLALSDTTLLAMAAFWLLGLPLLSLLIALWQWRRQRNPHA